jgi:uncharacterized protein
MLLDTSGLMCLFDRRDFRHQDALSFYNSASVRLTHNYVLVEFVALAQARHAPRVEALAFVADLFDDPEVGVVWIDEQLHQSALALLQERLDKAWSLCDAVSFLLMQQRGLTEALTTDHHFEQAGFIKLLKS